MELNDKTKNFLDFNRKVMVSKDGKDQVVINNKLQEIKYKFLKYQDR